MAAFELVAVTGGLHFELETGKLVVVGRSETSDLVVADSTISRRHAELKADDAGIAVRDLGSSNGTAINGTRITDGRVASNDTVTFGNVAFRVNMKGTPKVAEEPSAGLAVPGGTIVRQVAIRGQVPGLEESVAAESAPRDPKELARRLSLLLEISQKLSGELELEKLLSRIADIAFETMKVDRMAILLKEPDDSLVPVLSRGRHGDASGFRAPRSIAQAVVRDRVAILSDNTMQDERYTGKSIVMQSVRSAMASPLMSSGQEVLGLIYADNLTSPKSFSDEDLQFLVAFAGIAAIGIRNSRYAEQVQREALVRSNFERYFAPDVAKQIAGRSEQVAQGGDKRPVVVLFSDIRGFTSMSETMTPDGIAELLSSYFTEMVDIIFDHGGTLDKFIGDAIMALWGAPLPLPDAADRALKAAVQMQQTLRAMNAKWREHGRREISIGIGINSGEVFAGNIGSHKRLEYTVIGNAVNVASRLCGKAAGDEIIISEGLYQQLTDRPAVESVPPVELKNVSKPLPVYKVKW